MDKKGFWALLASVSKAWKTIFTRTNDSFRYRQAAGDDNILLPEKNGRAVFDKIYGTTVKFNQLIDWDNISVSRWAASGAAYWSFSRSGSKIIATCTTSGILTLQIEVTPQITNDTKVYVTIETKSSVGVSDFGICIGRAASKISVGAVTSTMAKFSVVGAVKNGYDTTATRIFFEDRNHTCQVGDTIEFDLGQLINLTAIGIDNLTTPEEVEAWLALNVGTQDYYPYDEGSLVSFKGQGVKSVGFNKWDGNNSEEGKMIIENDSYTVNASYNVSSYVRVLPKTYYFFKDIIGPNNTASHASLCWYNSKKEFISSVANNGSAHILYNALLESPVNAQYVRFTYEKNAKDIICINIHDTSSPSKDGTYEPYKEEIVDLSGAYINVWDEQWELGSFDIFTGEKTVTNDSIRCTNPIAVLPNTDYYLTKPALSASWVYFYDVDNHYISYLLIGNAEFTTPANCHYITFKYGYSSVPVTTYAHDICINVSNADIDGTYFPHALQSAGSVADEVTETELKKNMFEVNLGDTVNGDWTGTSTATSGKIAWITSKYINSIKSSAAATPFNSICNKYITRSYNDVYNNNEGVCVYSDGRLIIYDSTYNTASDKTDFITKLQSTRTPLIYELATPVVVPHDTPMQYKVDKYSTEEVIFPDSADGSPTSTAIVADISYQRQGGHITYIILDQTTSDPSEMIKGQINGTVIKWIRNNSHRYLGKYTSEGTMTLCQLKDDDSTKFYDGSSATLDGSQGDVFVGHPLFYTYAEEVGTDYNTPTSGTGIWKISFADYKVDDNWLKWDNGDLIGAYEAAATSNYNNTTANTTNDNTGYLRSISGVASLSSVSQSNFKVKASNRSSNFSLVRWEHQNIMAFLFYAIYGNTNAQAICGAGTAEYTKNTGLTNALGMTDTNSVNGNLSSINFFGLDNWWGNKYEWVDNVDVNGYDWTIADRNSGLTRVVTGQVSPVNTWVYPQRMVVGANLDLIPYPTQTGGDDHHGFCDGVYMTGTSGRVVMRSSYYASTQGGVAAAVVSSDSSFTHANRGSRLAFKGNIREVTPTEYNNAVAIG